MRKFALTMTMATAAAAVFVFGASAAGATVATNLSPTAGTLTLVDLTTAGPSKNLTNNGPYSSGPNSAAYLFYEGLNDFGDQTFLLHYDRSGFLWDAGTVAGSFQFSLGAGELFTNVYSTSAQLIASDDTNNGVTYQRCTLCLSFGATVFRGLEPPAFPVFGDFISISPDQGVTQNAPLYTVNYRFTNDGSTMDEIRFAFSGGAVPEPATWGMMIMGFGMAGAILRRRRTVAFA